MTDEWLALDLALQAGRPREALRCASALWAAHRAPALAELVDALAGFVESDPRSAPAVAPTDAAELGAWIAATSTRMLDIWTGSWWTRAWADDFARVHAVLEAQIASAPDPRLATMLAAVMLEPFILAHAGADLLRKLVGLLTLLADARVVAPMMEAATSPTVPASARTVMARGLADIDEAAAAYAPLAPDEVAIVTAGLGRYRDEPRRWIERVEDPTRDVRDGTEEVASDALGELGHPYGEAIALQLDADSGVLGAEGRERLKSLRACHEERWLGRELFLSLEDRSYRGGALDEATLRPGWRNFPSNAAVRRALDDVRVARLRVLRSGADDWDGEQAATLRASRWLSSSLVWLDAPSFEFLSAACDDRYPNLVGLRLQRLRPTRHDARFSSWAQAVAAWCEGLPALRELVFRTIPEDGLEGIIHRAVEVGLHRRIAVMTLDARAWSWVVTGERDPLSWFRMLDAHGVRSATLHLRSASLTAHWLPSGAIDVTLLTSEGGDAFDLLRRLPLRPIERLVLDEHPARRARKIEHLGRLKRTLAELSPREVVMPVRWRNWLDALK